MQVAPQHSEAIGQRSGMGVEEGLLLDRVTLHAAHVSPGDVQGAPAVEPYLAYSGLAVRNRAAVSAGVTAHPATLVDFLVELPGALAYPLVQHVLERGHGLVPTILRLHYGPIPLFGIVVQTRRRMLIAGLQTGRLRALKANSFVEIRQLSSCKIRTILAGPF